MHYNFYYLRKKRTQKASKVAATKKLFSSVYVIDITCSDEYFIIHLITGRHFFYKSLSLISAAFQPPCCVLWNKCFDISPYFTYLHNNSTILLPKFHMKFEYLLNFLIYSFLIMFSDFRKFLYKICFSNETQIFSESMFSFTNFFTNSFTDMCQKWIFLIHLIFYVYKGRIKSQMTRWPVYKQWFYKCYNSKFDNSIIWCRIQILEHTENTSNTERRKTSFPK